MKKFFVALLVLALAASNVFAEVSYSGNVWGVVDIVGGSSGKEPTKDADGDIQFDANGTPIIEDVDDDLQTKLGIQSNQIRSRFNITAANEDNTWGGALQLRFNEGKDDFSNTNKAVSALQAYLNRAWVWWQPIEQVKTTIGLVDGFRPFGVLWGKEVNDAAGTGGFGGGGGDIFTGIGANQGFALQLYPIDNLAIAIGAPITKGDAEDSYRKLSGWVGYTLGDIGTFALGYVGGAHYKAESEIEFGLNVTAISGVQLQLGVSYFLPEDDAKEATKTVSKPLVISLAWDVGAGDFGMRGHLKTSFLGKTEYKAANTKNDETGLAFGIVVTPFYNVGIGTIGVNIGVELTTENTKQGAGQKDDQIKWDITPYFEKSYGGGTFLVGVKIGGSNYLNDEQFKDSYGKMSWAIPVSLNYSF
jgi:hypothetical protein